MKIKWICLLLVLSLSSVYAQDNVDKLGLKEPAKSETVDEPLKMNLKMPDFRWEAWKYNMLQTSHRVDYNDIITTPIEESLYYSLYSSWEVAPGMFNIRQAGGEIGMRINKSFLINTGLYAMKYDFNFGTRPYYDGVAYLSVSYNINSWLSIGAYGQYSAGEKYNARHNAMLPTPFVPHSAYGISATTMFNKTFGLQGGVGKEFDPFTGQWHFNYGVAPVINLNTLFK